MSDEQEAETRTLNLATISKASSRVQGRRGSDRLRADIIRAIQEGQLHAGDRLPPIRELAQEYNLAFGTTRSVLSALEKDGRVERRNRSGTYVCEQAEQATARSVSTKYVALLIYPNAHYFSEIVASIAQGLQAHGLHCVPSAPEPGYDPFSFDEVRPTLDRWRDDPPYAVMHALRIHGLEREIDRILPTSTRRVRVLGRDEDLRPGWHTVGTNRRRAFELAVDHLLERGHERIGFALAGRNIRPEHGYQVRKAEHARHMLMLGDLLGERGHKRALTCFTTRPSPDGENHGPGKSTDPFAPHNLERAARWLSRPDRPTAVIAASDYRAVAIRAAAAKAGLNVPEDLELVGMYNTPWSQAYNLSTINHKPREIGQHAAQLVVDDATGPGSASRQICIEPELIVRDGRSEAALLPGHGDVGV
ncbi:MAG: substrate-binding domain-containing protein [bacterium]